MTLSAPSRSRAAHVGPERRRPQVLDAALAIAVESGIGAVTIGAVAEHIGVTRPVVYACFDDRITLLDALLQRERDGLLAGALKALHGARGGDPEAVFVGGYQALLGAVAQHPDSWRLLFDASPDAAVAAIFADARAILADSAAQWLRPALTRWWGMRDVDRKLPVLTELFMSSCEAAMRSLLRLSSTWRPDALGEFYGRAMYRAFRGA